MAEEISFAYPATLTVYPNGLIGGFSVHGWPNPAI
jgi:hypothetical protein